MAKYLTRYGYTGEVDYENSNKIALELIDELRTEEHEVQDDEHAQVSISNEHWSITAQKSGLITFDNLELLEGKSSDLPEEMYMRNIEDRELIHLWQTVILSDVEKLMSFSWLSFGELPDYVSDHYREDIR